MGQDNRYLDSRFGLENHKVQVSNDFACTTLQSALDALQSLTH
jgi:hypothetical protein